MTTCVRKRIADSWVRQNKATFEDAVNTGFHTEFTRNKLCVSQQIDGSGGAKVGMLHNTGVNECKFPFIYDNKVHTECAIDMSSHGTPDKGTGMCAWYHEPPHLGNFQYWGYCTPGCPGYAKEVMSCRNPLSVEEIQCIDITNHYTKSGGLVANSGETQAFLNRCDTWSGSGGKWYPSFEKDCKDLSDAKLAAAEYKSCRNPVAGQDVLCYDGTNKFTKSAGLTPKVTTAASLASCHTWTSDGGKWYQSPESCYQMSRDQPPTELMYARFENKDAGTSWTSTVGSFTAVSSARVFPVPRTSALEAWFKSEDVLENSWTSSVVSTAHAATGSFVVSTAKGGVRAASGGTSNTMKFGKILPAIWTMCSATRYTGAARRRILKGTGNFAFAAYGGVPGKSYQNGFTSSYDNVDTYEWALFCGTNNGMRAYVNDRSGNIVNIAASDYAGSNGNKYVGVNVDGGTPDYGCCNEASDFEVAEVLTWNEALGDADMREAVRYLKSKFGGPVAPVRVSVAPGNGLNGAHATLSALSGTANHAINFGKIIPLGDVTVCALTRYTSSDAGKQNRVLQGETKDSFWGHTSLVVGTTVFGTVGGCKCLASYTYLGITYLGTCAPTGSSTGEPWCYTASPCSSSWDYCNANPPSPGGRGVASWDGSEVSAAPGDPLYMADVTDPYYDDGKVPLSGANGVCSSGTPCQSCVNECDDDNHCAGNLKCFQRHNGLIPGCSGILGNDGDTLWDYCYDPDWTDVRPRPKTDWLTMCTSNGQTFFYGDGTEYVGQTSAAAAGSNDGLTINSGFAPDATSDFEVAEVIVWNKKLNTREMRQSSAYLESLLGLPRTEIVRSCQNTDTSIDIGCVDIESYFFRTKGFTVNGGQTQADLNNCATWAKVRVGGTTERATEVASTWVTTSKTCDELYGGFTHCGEDAKSTDATAQGPAVEVQWDNVPPGCIVGVEGVNDKKIMYNSHETGGGAPGSGYRPLKQPRRPTRATCLREAKRLIITAYLKDGVLEGSFPGVPSGCVVNVGSEKGVVYFNNVASEQAGSNVAWVKVAMVEPDLAVEEACPLTQAEFNQASWDVINDEEMSDKVWGPIETWDVSQVASFRAAFTSLRKEEGGLSGSNSKAVLWAGAGVENWVTYKMEDLRVAFWYCQSFNG